MLLCQLPQHALDVDPQLDQRHERVLAGQFGLGGQVGLKLLWKLGRHAIRRDAQGLALSRSAYSTITSFLPLHRISPIVGVSAGWRNRSSTADR